MGDVPDAMADGSEAFFSSRQPAWHRMGTVIDGDVDLDTALKTAHLDYVVEKTDKPATITVENKTVVVPGYYGTWRKNPVTGIVEPMGIVGSDYTPTQNPEAFAALIDVNKEAGATFETGGTMRDGRVAFLTIKMPEDYLVGGVDAHRLYLFGWNSHDGSTSIRVTVTDVRVVCKNTADLAWGGAVKMVTIRHTKNAADRAKQARELLGVTSRYQEEAVKAAEALLAQPMTDKAFDVFVDALFPVKKETPRSEALATTRRNGVRALWKAPTQENIAGTKYAALQAVTEWADWFSPVTGGKMKDPDLQRAQRVSLGAGTKVKTRAYALLAPKR